MERRINKMNEWKYIDEYESLPNTDFIHCDTRDFHIICVNNKGYKRETRLELKRINTQSMFSDCLFTKDEILKILKDLENRSGGKGNWRHIQIDDIHWLKYIRFIKWNDDKYLAYANDDCKILSHELLESSINEEYLNFMK